MLADNNNRAVGVAVKHESFASEEAKERFFENMDSLEVGEEGPVCSIEASRKQYNVDYLKVQQRAYQNNAFRYSPSLHAAKAFAT